MAKLTFTFKESCRIPVIEDIQEINNEIVVMWAMNDVELNAIYRIQYIPQGSSTYVTYPADFFASEGEARIPVINPKPSTYRIISNFKDCVDIASNPFTVIVRPNIYCVQSVDSNGKSAFHVHVENEPFIGYLNAMFTNGNNNTSPKVSEVNIENTYMLLLKLNNGAGIGSRNRKSIAVNLPIGIYEGSVTIEASTSSPDPSQMSPSLVTEIGFAFTNIVEDNIQVTKIFTHYEDFN